MYGIPGLLYVPEYLTAAEHDDLVRAIDAAGWRTDLSRRTQQYDYVYEHKARLLHADDHLGPLPDWLAPFARRLAEDGLMDSVPDQAILNEYEPGQGIGKHVDATPAFGPVVVSVSLLSTAAMELKRGEGPAAEQISVVLEPRSALTLRGPARYEWRHGVPARRTDIIGGVAVPRSRRVSVTFRTVTRKTD